MDTKTAKTEALYILSVIERGSADAEFLGDARRKFYELMKARGCDRRDYLDSVDACLTLPRAPGQWWDLSGDVEGRETTAMPCRAILKLEGTAQYAKTLALAMLKAWWALQD